MRVTIVSDDQKVSVNNYPIEGLDLSFLSSDIHAVQWYDTKGEVEFRRTADGYHPPNLVITDLTPFQPAIDAWRAAYAVLTAPPPEPSDAEKLVAQQDKAKSLLYASDWAVLPDVALVNQSDWLAYRSALRLLATTETALVDSFPTAPPVIWA